MLFGGMFTWFADYGKYGVQIFFVVSGFVIPFSLFKGGYTINDYPRFLYKRVLRLHPPYLVALALTLLIMAASYKARHIAFPENTETMFKSLFYLHIPADNPVFWTLAVEAQYYLFIGIFYIIPMNFPKLALYIVVPALAVLSQTTAVEYISFFQYIIFFLIGTVGFLIYTKNGIRTTNMLVLIALLLFSAYFYTFAEFTVAAITVAVILTYKGGFSSALQFSGKISYSIYLLHFPLGIKFINLIKPRISPNYTWVLFILALVITYVASWVFYRVFEEYSEALSRKIKYRAADLKQPALV